MITFAFVKMAMDTLLYTNKVFYLGNGSTINNEYGQKKLSFSRIDDGTSSVTIKSDAEVYFDEASDKAAHTVNGIVSCCYESKGPVPYYLLPLQSSVEIPASYQIKVNPYKENDEGVHTRGIMVKFSVPEV